MKAFWWFKENSIAGMARPGFNAIKWFDLDFDEAQLLAWLGQFSSGSQNLMDFRNHVKTYSPRIFKFYNLNEDTGYKALEIFDSNETFLEVAERLKKKSKIFESIHIENESVHFKICQNRLLSEIGFLKKNKIDSIISLTEQHHGKDILDEHFDTYHFSIKDLGAPEFDQVVQLAEVIKKETQDNKKIAVHCLAGIGRTSTMLVCSHIALGEDFNELKNLIGARNPSFVFTGVQGEFIQKVAKRFQL